MSSPERGTRGAYEEPYYSQYGTRGGSVTPIIDEEQRYKLNADIRSIYPEPQYFHNKNFSFPFNETKHSDISMNEDQYALYGHKVSGRIPRTANQMYDPTR